MRRVAFSRGIRQEELCAELLGEYIRALDEAKQFPAGVPRRFEVPERLAPKDPAWESHPKSEEIRERLLLVAEIISRFESGEFTSLNASAVVVSGRERKGGRDGLSPQNLHQMAKAYAPTRDWRVILNKSKAPEHPREWTPFDSAEFLRFLEDEYSVSTAARRRGALGKIAAELLDRFKSGESIPGYGNWRAHWEWMHRKAEKKPVIPNEFPETIQPGKKTIAFIPFGCSARNLTTRFAKAPVSRKRRKH